MKKKLPSLLITALLGMGSFCAVAQPAPPADPLHGPQDMGHVDPARMEQMINRQMNALKTKLKITPQQEAAWTAYTSAMKPTGEALAKHPDRAELDKLPTPERLDKMKALRAQHIADMNALLDKRDEATKTFYAQLSSEQQQIFDTEHGRKGQYRKVPRAKMEAASKPKP